MGRYPLKTEIGKYMTEVKDYYAPATLNLRRKVLFMLADLFDGLCERDPSLNRNPRKWREREATAIALAMRETGIASNTLANYLGVIQAFLEYLGNGTLRAMRRKTFGLFPREAYERKPSLTEEELAKVLDATDLAKGWNGECMRFLFRTYAYTGLRLNELRLASPTDLDTAKWTLHVRHPKGERSFAQHRVVPIPEPLRPAIVCYLKARDARLGKKGKLESTYLVFSRDNTEKPVGDSTIQCWKRKLESWSGVDFTTHSLRRTYGQILLNRGVPLESVSLALGHASTVTTEKHYCRKDAGVARLEIARAFASPANAPSLNPPMIDKKEPLPGYA